MGNDIMAYIQKLELFGFFSGYCLIYTIIFSLKSNNNSKAQTLLNKLTVLLPYAYALTATLYLGMVIKNISLDFSMRNFNEQFHIPYLTNLGTSCRSFLDSFFQQKNIFELIAQPCIFFLFSERYFYPVKATSRQRDHSQ